MDTKSLSFCHVCWSQELFYSYFWIYYCQGKTNGAANALSRFSQRDDKEETNLQAENTQILHYLQFSLITLESFIVCSLHRQTRHFQVSITRFGASCSSTRSSSEEPTLCHSSGVSGVPSKPSSPMSDLTKPVLVIGGWGCKSCRRPTLRPKN